MKNIVFAIKMNGVNAQTIQAFEDGIIKELSDKNQSIQIGQRYHCDHQDGLLELCQKVKPDILVINEKLEGNGDFADLIRNVRSELPEVQIIVLLKEQRDVGDVLLATLVTLGIYNWIVSPWSPKDIATLILESKQLKDVSIYMPRIVRNERGLAFDTVVVEKESLEDLNDLNTTPAKEIVKNVNNSERVSQISDVEQTSSLATTLDHYSHPSPSHHAPYNPALQVSQYGFNGTSSVKRVSPSPSETPIVFTPSLGEPSAATHSQPAASAQVATPSQPAAAPAQAAAPQPQNSGTTYQYQGTASQPQYQPNQPQPSTSQNSYPAGIGSNGVQTPQPLQSNSQFIASGDNTGDDKKAAINSGDNASFAMNTQNPATVAATPTPNATATANTLQTPNNASYTPRHASGYNNPAVQAMTNVFTGHLGVADEQPAASRQTNEQPAASQQANQRFNTSNQANNSFVTNEQPSNSQQQHQYISQEIKDFTNNNVERNPQSDLDARTFVEEEKYYQPMTELTEGDKGVPSSPSTPITDILTNTIPDSSEVPSITPASTSPFSTTVTNTPSSLISNPGTVRENFDRPLSVQDFVQRAKAARTQTPKKREAVREVDTTPRPNQTYLFVHPAMDTAIPYMLAKKFSEDGLDTRLTLVNSEYGRNPLADPNLLIELMQGQAFEVRHQKEVIDVFVNDLTPDIINKADRVVLVSYEDKTMLASLMSHPLLNGKEFDMVVVRVTGSLGVREIQKMNERVKKITYLRSVYSPAKGEEREEGVLYGDEIYKAMRQGVPLRDGRVMQNLGFFFDVMEGER